MYWYFIVVLNREEREKKENVQNEMEKEDSDECWRFIDTLHSSYRCVWLSFRSSRSSRRYLCSPFIVRIIWPQHFRLHYLVGFIFRFSHSFPFHFHWITFRSISERLYSVSFMHSLPVFFAFWKYFRRKLFWWQSSATAWFESEKANRYASLFQYFIYWSLLEESETMVLNVCS